MGNTTVYSFLDTVGSISCDLLENYIFTGKGLGSITVTRATENTTHDVASDGSVMVSKVAGSNGTVTIECQQTSEVHRWLQKWYNALESAPTSEWAGTDMTIKNTNTGVSHTISGVSPRKPGDNAYQQQGQRVQWTLMAADIVNNPS